MITDKDREDAENIAGLYAPYDCDEMAAGYVSTIRAESADQARKEAAERAAEWFKTVFCVPENAKTKGLRAAILGDSATVSTDSEKLAIAVKALEWALKYIGDGVLPDEGTPEHDCGYIKAPDEGYCEFCENYWNARDALKEIHG